MNGAVLKFDIFMKLVSVSNRQIIVTDCKQESEASKNNRGNLK